MVVGNGGQKDCAQMWFGPDFRGSLKVQVMTWAERGMYRHLLDLAWENEGLPNDLLELRDILGITQKQFAKAWKRIGRCFEVDAKNTKRLINVRQEKERMIRAEFKRRRSEAATKANAVRWGSDSDSDRSPNGVESGSLSPSPSPSPPAGVPLSPAGPPVGGLLSSLGEQDGRSAPTRPAGRSGTELEVFSALRATSYRRNSRDRDHHLAETAARLHAAGISGADLLVLAKKAAARGKKPSGLFAHWLDHLDEALKELGKR